MGGRVQQRGSASGDVRRDFAELYRESYPVVYNHVRVRADGDAVEGIVAGAFLEAARSFRSYDPARASFSTWVVGIAEGRLASSPSEEGAAARPDSVAEGASSVSVGQDAGDDGVLVDALLGCLDGDERVLVLMRYRDGLRAADIAAAAGVDEPAVSSGLSRALSKMRAVVSA